MLWFSSAWGKEPKLKQLEVNPLYFNVLEVSRRYIASTWFDQFAIYLYNITQLHTQFAPASLPRLELSFPSRTLGEVQGKY